MRIILPPPLPPNINCVLKLHVFWSVCKMWPQQCITHSVWFKNADSQTGSFMISQYVGLEFVRTQLNLCILLIKRLVYICLLMAAGIKWRLSNLQIKMYKNISDSPISGLLWHWSKSNERKFGRKSNPQRNNHNLFFCLPASERWQNKYDISKRESEREGKTLFFSHEKWK